MLHDAFEHLAPCSITYSSFLMLALRKVIKVKRPNFNTLLHPHLPSHIPVVHCDINYPMVPLGMLKHDLQHSQITLHKEGRVSVEYIPGFPIPI